MWDLYRQILHPAPVRRHMQLSWRSAWHGVTTACLEQPELATHLLDDRLHLRLTRWLEKIKCIFSCPLTKQAPESKTATTVTRVAIIGVSNVHFRITPLSRLEHPALCAGRRRQLTEYVTGNLQQACTNLSLNISWLSSQRASQLSRCEIGCGLSRSCTVCLSFTLPLSC